VISSLDVNATMLDALGAPPLPTSRGRSLLPILRADGPDGDHSNEGSSLDTATAWRDEAFSEYCTDEGCLHRMVRKGPWKLNYYHGQEPQLFNLEEDPGELRDLAANPDYRDVREELTSRVLDGWDPAEISVRLEELRCDGRILTDWGRNVQPPDRCRWDLRPEMDYLD
jgi:choline-sulfatase